MQSESECPRRHTWLHRLFQNLYNNRIMWHVSGLRLLLVLSVVMSSHQASASALQRDDVKKQIKQARQVLAASVKSNEANAQIESSSDTRGANSDSSVSSTRKRSLLPDFRKVSVRVNKDVTRTSPLPEKNVKSSSLPNSVKAVDPSERRR